MKRVHHRWEEKPVWHLPSTKATCGIVPSTWNKLAPKIPVPNIWKKRSAPLETYFSAEHSKNSYTTIMKISPQTDDVQGKKP